MKLNEKQKIIVAVLGIVVVVGALAAFNYFKFRERLDLLAKIDVLASEENKANDLIGQIPDLRDKRANLANIIDQYAGILPLEQHVQHEAFAEIIDNYSRETNVVIQRVAYLTPKVKGKPKDAARTKENFIRHRYRLNLIGTFPDFLRFINKIENHTRFLKIDEIQIHPIGRVDPFSKVGEKDEGKVLEQAKIPFKEIELVLSTYTYKRDVEPSR